MSRPLVEDLTGRLPFSEHFSEGFPVRSELA